jgi:hypothetical protein
MKNRSILQLALGLFTINSSVSCMHIVPALIKNSLSKRYCSYIVNSKYTYTQEDKMTYYKQFCTSINVQNNKFNIQQTQTFTIKTSSSQEDKMAYYKQFSTTQ